MLKANLTPDYVVMEINTHTNTHTYTHKHKHTRTNTCTHIGTYIIYEI